MALLQKQQQPTGAAGRRASPAGAGGRTTRPRPVVAARAAPPPPTTTEAAAAPAATPSAAAANGAAATTSAATAVRDKPAWTGDSLLSRAVNGAIANPVLFGVMRVLAKAAMRRSARERGVDWAAHVAALERRAASRLAPLAREFAATSGLGMGPYEQQEEGDEGAAASSSSSSSPYSSPPLPPSPYPGYYLVPFHSYERGNLEWGAAYEVEPASLAIAMRTFAAEAPLAPSSSSSLSSSSSSSSGAKNVGAAAETKESLEAAFAGRAMAKMRRQITGAVRDYVIGRRGLPAPRRVLDVGCSTGISTRWLGLEFEEALGAEQERGQQRQQGQQGQRGQGGQEGAEGAKGGGAAGGGSRALEALVGLDLSPYFLAVAEDEERRREATGDDNNNNDDDDENGNDDPSAALLGGRAAPRTLTRPRFVHGLAEKAPFPDASFDLVALNFVAHECPGHVIDTFCAEARRLLAPGSGVLCFSDNDPQSETIQNLPVPIFTLMKSTEPWSDDYYAFDLPGALRRAGFADVVSVASDHRHRVVMGTAPPPGGLGGGAGSSE